MSVDHGMVAGRSRCPALLRGSQCFLDVGHLGMHTTDLRGVMWRDGEMPSILHKYGLVITGAQWPDNASDDVKTMQPAGDKEPK